MKKCIVPFKGLFSLILVFVLVIVSQNTVFASAATSESKSGLISVEVVPNKEADKMLPDSLYKMVANDNKLDGKVSTKSLDIPDSDHIWDLGTKGKYSFHVDTSRSAIFSNYVYTGHSGGIKVHLEETMPAKTKYTFMVCKRGMFNTTIYRQKYEHNAKKTFEIKDIDSSAKIYFIVEPHNTDTYLNYNSYIKKL